MRKAMGVVLLLPALAWAQGKEKAAAAGAPEMPPPAEELSVEKWFVGNWTCEGMQHASPMGPEMKTTTTEMFKMDVGGYWLHYTIDYVKPKKMPWLQGFSTWDAAGKRHVRVDLMAGSGWAQVQTTGWEGDKLVFTGDMMAMGKKMPAKHTITKKGETEWGSVLEVGGPDGKMMTLIEETCKKKK